MKHFLETSYDSNDMVLPPFFQLSVYMFIFNKKMFRLFFLYKFVLRKSYKHMQRCATPDPPTPYLTHFSKVLEGLAPAPMLLIYCNSSSHMFPNSWLGLIFRLNHVHFIILWHKILFSVLGFTNSDYHFDILEKGGNGQQIPGQIEWFYFI